MWIEDLTPITSDGSCIAVGWLARDYPYSTGEVAEDFFEQLCQLLQNAWDPGPYTAGMHHCELCRFTQSSESHYGNYRISSTSSSCLYVPDNGFLYVAPVSIAHYIDAHGYQPPHAFCEAVRQCPEMRSIAYMKAILANGGRALVKNTKRSL